MMFSGFAEVPHDMSFKRIVNKLPDLKQMYWVYGYMSLAESLG